MSIPPFITVPSTSCYASVVMTMTRVVGNTASPFTMEEQAFKWPGEIWTMDLKMPPITSRAVADDWNSFGLSLEGIYGRFLAGDPAGRTPRGVATGTPLVDGGGQEGNTLITNGWTAGVTGIMRKGDYFQLGTGLDSRLYKMVDDATSDGSGEAELTFVPALRSSPADNAPLVVSNAKGVFRLTDNQWSWAVEPGPVYRIGFTAHEVVNA